jgi:integrase/recombinase XerD
MPKAHLTYIVTAYGRPRSKYGLGNDFGKWVTEAGLPTCCRLHGLKKGGMRRLAESGNTTHELMAISGHKTLSEVQRYTDDADRKRLAESGMAKRRSQSVNVELSNPAAKSVKPPAKSLRQKG